jgi:hypothetical protein
MKEFFLKNRKAIVYGAVVVGGIWLISKIIRKRKEENELAEYMEKPHTPTSEIKQLSDESLRAIAKNLFSAMDGYGTYEDVIYSNFRKLNNEADYQALLKIFGRKKLCYGIALCTEGNLPYLLRSELSVDEVGYVNGILSNKGIKSRI